MDNKILGYVNVIKCIQIKDDKKLSEKHNGKTAFWDDSEKSLYEVVDKKNDEVEF